MGEMNYFNQTAIGSHIKRRVPILRVGFHTKDKYYVTTGKSVNSVDELSPTNQVLSVMTQKTLDNPAGAFTIRLIGDEWLTRLNSNDIVEIEMGYEGETMRTIMVGLIDSPRRSRVMSGNKPMVATTVTGRDFGKLFVQGNLKFYPEVGATNSEAAKFFLTETGWTALMKFFTNDNIAKGTPAVLIDNIMRYLLLRLFNVNWAFYRNGKKTTVGVGDVVRYQLEHMNVFLPLILTADQFEGSLWNLMERAQLKPFGELFIDVRSPSEAWNPSGKGRVVVGDVEESSSSEKSKLKKDAGYYPSPALTFGEENAKVVLALRMTPFDSKDRKNLVTHHINEVDVTSEDLGFGDQENYNLFWAGTTINPLGIDLKRVAPPQVNLDNIQRYGMSPLEVEVEGLEILGVDKTKDTNNLDSMSRTYTSKLKAWYENNKDYWSGTIEVRGDGAYRIGHRIIYDALGREFYLESVTQNFDVFVGWKSTLGVTRGMVTDTKVDSSTVLVTVTPAKPAPKTPPKPADKYYTVRRGDTLWAIAKKYYKGGTKWRKIWEANKAMLIARDKRNATDPGHWIFPGQKLRVPQ